MNLDYNFFTDDMCKLRNTIEESGFFVIHNHWSYTLNGRFGVRFSHDSFKWVSLESTEKINLGTVLSELKDSKVTDFLILNIDKFS